MHNMIYLIGRLTDDPQLAKEEEGKEFATITLAVQRQYKNEDGIYETDFVPVRLWNVIGNTTSEYCHKGDLVGIKGRIQTIDNKLEVVADKVSFLSSSKKED